MSEFKSIINEVLVISKNNSRSEEPLKTFTVLIGYFLTGILTITENEDKLSFISPLHDFAFIGEDDLLNTEKWEYDNVLDNESSILQIQIGFIRDLIFNRNFKIDADFFEYSLGEFLKSARTKYLFLPAELVKLSKHLLCENENPLVVLNIYSGFGEFALSWDRKNCAVFNAEESNPWVRAFQLLRTKVHDQKYNVRDVNSYDCDKEYYDDFYLKSNAIFGVLPFNVRLGEYDPGYNDFKFKSDYILSEFKNDLAKDGTAVFLVNSSMLTNANDRWVNLVQQGWVDTVIQLPSKLFTATAIQTALVVLRKQDQVLPQIRFIDASELFVSQRGQNQLAIDQVLDTISNGSEFSRVVSITEVMGSDYHLHPGRYVYRNFELEGRDDYVEIGAVASKQTMRFAVGDEAYAIKFSELSKNGSFLKFELNSASKSRHQHPRKLTKASPGDVVVTLRGSSFQPTLVGDVKHLGAMCPPLLVLKLNTDRIDSEYFLSALNSAEVTRQIAQFGVGVMGITVRDFFKIKIRLPSLDEQRSIVQSVKQGLLAAQAKELGVADELKQKQSDFFENLAYNRHTVNQDLGKVRSIALTMTTIMEERGLIKLDDLVSPLSNDTVKDRINDLHCYLDQISDQLQTLSAAPKLSEGVEINILDFISQWIENAHRPLNVDIPTLIENEIPKDIKVLFGLKEFNGVLDNLFENAVRHGFINENESYIFSINLNLNNSQDSVILTIANNGEALPVGIAEKYHLRGLKAGTNGNTGMGTAIVSESVQNYGGKIKVLDSNDEFSVNIQIELPIYDRGE